MRLSLLPKGQQFFDLFSAHIAECVAAAELLNGISDIAQLSAVHAEVKAKEHRGDDITHQLVHALDSTFVTPFDREDLYALASRIDDVLDLIDDTVDALALYSLQEMPKPVHEMSGLVLSATQKLQEALGLLGSGKKLDEYWVEIHRLENEGDDISRAAIAELFANQRDAIDVIKLKDVYALVENALDRCEDVANVIESMTIKHA